MLSMVIDSISSFMYSKLLVIMLIGTGVYYNYEGENVTVSERPYFKGAAVSQRLQSGNGETG